MNLLGRTIIFGIDVLPRSKAQYSNVTKSKQQKEVKQNDSKQLRWYLRWKQTANELRSSNHHEPLCRNLKEITLKARGQAITTAVDVAEITRNRFVKDLKVSKIAIGTVEMPPREGENKFRMVSTMEITLTKK
jgi:DNA-binding protein Alba